MTYEQELENELTKVFDEIERGSELAMEDEGMFMFMVNHIEQPERIDRYISSTGTAYRENLARSMADAVRANQYLLDRAAFIKEELEKVRSNDRN